MSDSLFEQFREFIAAMNAMNQAGAFLVTGNSMDEDYKQFLNLVEHVEQLWAATCTLFQARHYSQALYLAVAVIEEVGKIGVVRFQIFIRQAYRDKGTPVRADANGPRKGNPFFSHPQKHLLAAGGGALINNRLRRIVGEAPLRDFLEKVKSGEIEKLRQSALYADLGVNGPLLPGNRVSKDQATFFVVLAGELMAEILGLDPHEFERLLDKVQNFERSIGHAWQ
jgi:AbiV family abortive infection protein